MVSKNDGNDRIIPEIVSSHNVVIQGTSFAQIHDGKGKGTALRSRFF
jgi:hypothetical protein